MPVYTTLKHFYNRGAQRTLISSVGGYQKGVTLMLSYE